MKQKFWQRMFSIVLLAGMLLSFVQPQTAQAAAPAADVPPTLAEIDPALLVEIEQQGSASFFVVMSEKADLSAAYEIEDWSARGWYVYNTLLETARRSQAEVIAYAEKNGLEYRSFYTNNSVYFPNGTGQTVQDLAAFAGVEWLRLEGYASIMPDQLAPTFGPTNGLESPDAYGYNLTTLAPAASGGLYGMQAVQVWDTYGVKGSGIVVANIDTGATYNHEALVRQYRGNNGDGSFTHDYNWYMPTSGCGDGTYACDNNGHGSGTMGIMVGETENLVEQIGIAPEATWIACKGCETTGCSDAALTGCADWMVAPCAIGDDPGDPSCDPDMRPHIVNNSWGGGGFDDWYQGYVQAWVASGIFPAFSAGNTVGCSTLGSPGDNPEAFGTAAHSSAGENTYAGGPSGFYPTPSCDPDLHQIDPHISSPTFGRTSNATPGTYYNLSGTSGASPHTAGAVALIWSANPAYIGDIYGTFTVLEQTANHDYFSETGCGKPACAGTNIWPNYDYGWGFLDALAAVEYVGVGGQGALNGHVIETNTLSAPGDPLEGVTITAYPQGPGGTQSTTTDVTGYYTITLVAGWYTVTATSPYYTTVEEYNIEIITGTVETQDFAMDPKGMLYGYVTDADNGFGLDATVTADDGSFVATDPADGYYELYLDAGTYDVTAAATDYAPETATGLVIGVGGTLQQDFALLAAVSFEPAPLEIDVTLGTDDNMAVTLTNNQPTPYDFEFIEKPGDYVPTAGEDVLVVAYDTTAATAMQAALTANGYTYVQVTAATFNTMPVADLLLYKALFWAGNTSSTYTAHQMEFLDNGGSLYISDNDLGYSNGTSVFYQTYLQATYNGDNGGDLVTGLDVMAGLNPDITPDPFPDYFTVGAEGVEIFEFTTTGNAAGVLVDRAGYKAIYTSWDFDDIVAVADETELVARVMDFLAVPDDVLWFNIIPDMGTVPATDYIDATAYFTATGAAGVTQPGDYHMTLKVDGDPEVEVPVVMHVLPSATMGLLDGTVTSDRPGGALEADILIEDDLGGSWMTTADPATGYYSYWLEEYGTYTVTASYPGYQDGIDTFAIVAGMTTTVDIELVLDAPWIDVDPDFLDVTVTFGDSISDTLWIYNDGEQDLDFAISEGGESYSPNRAPIGTEAAWPGPDGFGYEGEVVDYDWVEISATGTMIPQLADDSFSAALPIGFTFNLYGVDYTQFYVSSNGFLSFGAGSTALTNQCPLPNATTPNDIIALLWDDLDPGDNSDPVYYQYFPSCPVGGGACTVVQYEDFCHYPGGATCTSAGTFEAVMYDNGSIMVQYEDAGGEGGSGSTTGIENNNVASDYGLTFACDTAATLYDELAICYTYPGSSGCAGDIAWLSEDPITGTVSTSGWVEVDVTFDAGVVSAPGVYMANLVVGNNDPLNDRVTIPVTMTVEPTADLGLLEGVITSDRPGGPLEADLLIEDAYGGSWNVTSDPDTGYYFQWLYEETYTVTASAPGYLDSQDTVVITGMQTTIRDFELLLEQPEIAVNPLSMEEMLVFGEVATHTLYIENIGYADLEFSLREQDGGAAPVISIPPFTGVTVPDNRPISFGPAPNAPQANGTLGIVINGAPAYGIDLATDTLYNWPDIGVPGTWNSVGASGIGSGYTGDFMSNDFTKLYVVDSDNKNLYTVNTASGGATLVGATGIPAGLTTTGMAWDETTGTMYIVATDGATANLYTLNTTSGAATLVAPLPSDAAFTIAIAVSPDGVMFGHEISQDRIITIDKSTGAVTTIGLTGLAANYAQGMDFDDDTGILYLAAYTASGALYIADTATGATTLVGAFPGGAEVDSFAIQTAPASDIPWLSEDPTDGTVPMGETGMVDVIFDSGQVLEPGTYFGNLHVNSNDPYVARVTLPVTLTVLPSGAIGLLDGNVQSLGHCDANPVPAEAEIIAENAMGGTWTIMSNAGTGYFSRWLPADTYTLTVSADDHMGAEAVVVVTEGMTTTHDFDLRWLAPCVSVDPLEFEVTVAQGYDWTESLDIANMGALGTAFELTEVEGGFAPAFNATAYRPAFVPANDPAARGGTALAQPARTVTFPAGLPMAGEISVLIISPDNTVADLVATLGAYPDLIVDAWPTSSAAPGLADMEPYGVVIVANDLLWTSPGWDKASIGNALADYIDGGGKVIEAMYVQSFDDWGFGGRYLTGGYSPFTTASLDVWGNGSMTIDEPTHPVMDGVATIDDTWGHQNPGLAAGAELLASWTDGYNGVAVNENVVALNLLLTESPGWSGDVGTLLHNAIVWLAGEGPGDVVWVYEVPVTGTVDADSVFTVDVTFVATPTMPLGTYTATLVLATDDMMGDIEIPLVLHVVESVLPDVVFTAEALIEVDVETTFYNVSFPGQPPATEFLWDFGDGVTMTAGLEDVTHTYLAAGIYDVTLEACNIGGCDSYTLQVEVFAQPVTDFFIWLPLIHKN